ncbi:MAG: hypothetical protein ACRDOG_14515 [Gaiellaceae bacterium]
MKGRETYRDHELGAALRELDVPEHRPEFYAELHTRLAEQRLARIDDRRRRARTRRSRVRWGARVALVAAVGVLAFVAYDIVRSDEGPGTGLVVEPASAAEIQQRVREALAMAQNLSGILVVEGRSYENAYGWDEPRRMRFTLTADGDFRLTGLTHEENIAYDASRGVQRSLNPSASIEGDDTLFAHVRRGIAPGPPDEIPAPSDSLLQSDFGAFVRALLAAEDPRVKGVVYEGRRAWRLEVDASPNLIVPELSGDHFAITVDQQTGFPVRVVESRNGRKLDELRIEGLAVDRELPPDTFALEFPRGMEVMRSDDGFRRVDLAEVAGAVGYAPLVPAFVPEGYELAEVAVHPGPGFPTGPEAGNPPSTDVVSLSYRRGLDQLLVTTRLRHVPGSPDIWDDPLATGEGFRDEPQRVTLGRGALAGVEAELLIVPRNIPHIWALTDELVVTVAGDVGRADLLRVAESLGRGQ